MLAAFYGLVLSLILVMRFAPRSFLGRTALEQLVQRPLAWAAGLSRPGVIAALLIALVFLGAGEVVIMVGPELMTAYLVDLAIYIDVMAVSVALAHVDRLRQRWRSGRARIAAMITALGIAARIRAPRTARARRQRRTLVPPDNDDDAPAAEWRIAA